MNSHVLLEIIFVAGLREWNYIYSGGDGVLLLSLNNGLTASRKKNVSSK